MKQFAIRKDPAALLADLSRDDLAALVTALLKRQPELYDWVEGAISTPSASGQKPKARRKKVDSEVYRRQILGILHSLDRMRASEAYWHVSGLTDQLREVQETAMKFLDAGDAETALTILLTLVEEAGQAIEYIDDSDSYFGGFVNELGQPLAEVILSLDLSAVEREKLANKLTELAKYLSDYGMDETIDLAIQAAQYGWEDAPGSTKPPSAHSHVLYPGGPALPGMSFGHSFAPDGPQESGRRLLVGCGGYEKAGNYYVVFKANTRDAFGSALSQIGVIHLALHHHQHVNVRIAPGIATRLRAKENNLPEPRPQSARKFLPQGS